MGFLINCNNKGCGQLQEPFIDKETNEVHCSLCDQIISNVSSFTKRQMHSLKQYRPKKTETFSIKCGKCNKEGQPQIVNDNIVCGDCASSLDHLSPIFKNMLKTQLIKKEE